MRTAKLLTHALFAKKNEDFVPVALPHTWNALDGQDGGSDYHRGACTYRIPLPDPTAGKRQYIEFCGANHVAEVYCNGSRVGEHRGGFSTFRFELTEFLRAEGNELAVEVFNGVCDVYPQRADFTFFGGLYRDISFIEVEDAHFDLLKHGSNAVFVTPYSTGNTRFDVFPVQAEGCAVEVEIFSAEGVSVAAGSAEAAAHTALRLDVAQPHLWHGVEDPYLYSARVSLTRGDAVLDEIAVSFGYRSFHVCPNTGFWLNGKNFPLHGVCRHQDRKDKGWAISKEDHLQDAELIREVGANTVRLAHYQHDQYFYSLCDRMGFVVWAEIPFISQFLEGRDARDNTLSQMTELISQNYNHPSICFWGLCNEITIGGFCPAQLENMQSLHALCKKTDPSRLTTVAQLGGVPVDSDHVYVSDVQSYNYYYGWYSHTVGLNAQRMDTWHAANPDKCYGISEYGADHYPCWHSAAPVNHDYTEEYALWYHRELLKIFASRPFLWATHVWNMFDFAVDSRNEGGFKGINAKGLVTHDRSIKKDTFYLYKAWWTKEPLVHIAGRRFIDRSPEERDIQVLTNGAEVTLLLNGKEVGTVPAEDHLAVFRNVPLQMGENILAAVIVGAEDTVILNGVPEHNPAYDAPDLLAAMRVGNWFEEQKDEGEAVNHYSLETNFGEMLSNPECLQIFTGWIMSQRKLPQVEKMTLVSRIPNYQTRLTDQHVRDIPAIRRLLNEDDLALLDRMLRRVKKAK